MPKERPGLSWNQSYPRHGYAIDTRQVEASVSFYQKQLVALSSGLLEWCRNTEQLKERREIDDEFAKGMHDELDPERRDIKIICIADTHNTQPTLPRGDVLIHAGDLTSKGTFQELQAQLNWINQQPHPYKIVVAGNHDILLDPIAAREQNFHRSAKELEWGSIIYLENSDTALEVGNRKIRIYGSPLTPSRGDNWAFQYDPSLTYDTWAKRIPSDTDIVVVHGPPFAHLDRGKGDEGLSLELERVKPRLVVCGHVHAGYGEELLVFDSLQRKHDAIKTGKKGIGTACSMLAETISHRMMNSGRDRITRLVNCAILTDFPEHDGVREPAVITL